VQKGELHLGEQRVEFWNHAGFWGHFGTRKKNGTMLSHIITLCKLESERNWHHAFPHHYLSQIGELAFVWMPQRMSSGAGVALELGCMS
jgi:hypothetical protein